MNRIDARFSALKSARRAGLIPFITAGDPLPDAMVDLMHALVEGGADLIELGVPFSDPMADGPVIQHASERALARGVGLDQIFEWVTKFRRTDQSTPIVLMGYLNPIEIRGYAQFARDAAQAGVDGALIVDCPLEESSVLAPLRDAGLHQIFLAAPTTSDVRLAALSTHAQGFLYYVSFAGVTGAHKLDLDAVRARVNSTRLHARVPIAVGFGVRDAFSAVAIAEFADAVVIGSALVEFLHGESSSAGLCAKATGFLAPIRAALDAAQATHAA